MTLRHLRDDEIREALTYEATIDQSGPNPIIDATDQGDETPFVGVGHVCRVIGFSITNNSSVESMPRVETTSGDLIWGQPIPAGESLSYYIPVELEPGEGVSVDLDDANEHHICIHYWVREQ